MVLSAFEGISKVTGQGKKDGATSADKGEAFPGGLVVQGKGKSKISRCQKQTVLYNQEIYLFSPCHHKKDATY